MATAQDRSRHRRKYQRRRRLVAMLRMIAHDCADSQVWRNRRKAQTSERSTAWRGPPKLRRPNWEPPELRRPKWEPPKLRRPNWATVQVPAAPDLDTKPAQAARTHVRTFAPTIHPRSPPGKCSHEPRRLNSLLSCMLRVHECPHDCCPYVSAWGGNAHACGCMLAHACHTSGGMLISMQPASMLSPVCNTRDQP